MINSFLKLIMLIAFSILLVNCEKKESPTITNPDDNSGNNSNTSALETEKQKIISTYLLWSNYTLNKNYEKASASIGQGCGIELDLSRMKTKWDQGTQLYYKFSNIIAVLDEEDLRKNMGWAQGDVTIFDGDKVSNMKFTSSCYKENNKWLICGMFFEE